MRGRNLKAGNPDGDRGRRLGGKAHAARNLETLDDSGRTLAQYWGQLGFLKLARKLGGVDAARAHMSTLGVQSYAKERRAFSRYLGEMRRQSPQEF